MAEADGAARLWPWAWRERIEDPGWIDYNGHLNVAFYALIFDHALDAAADALGLGADYRAATGCSVFVLETHTRFLSEVRAGAEVIVRSRLLAADGKRVLVRHEMREGEGAAPVARQDALAIHVDLGVRRARPWPEAIAADLARLAAPPAGGDEPAAALGLLALARR